MDTENPFEKIDTSSDDHEDHEYHAIDEDVFCSDDNLCPLHAILHSQRVAWIFMGLVFLDLGLVAFNISIELEMQTKWLTLYEEHMNKNCHTIYVSVEEEEVHEDPPRRLTSSTHIVPKWWLNQYSSGGEEESTGEEHHECLPHGTVPHFHEELEPYHDILFYTAAVSMSVLTLFLVENLLIMVDAGAEYLHPDLHFMHWIEFLAVAVSLVLEYFLEVSQGGLLVICRLWRLVRIGEAITNLDHMEQHDLDEHAMHGGTKDDYIYH